MKPTMRLTSALHDSINTLRLAPNERLSALHALRLSEYAVDSVEVFLQGVQRVLSGLPFTKPMLVTSLKQ